MGDFSLLELMLRPPGAVRAPERDSRAASRGDAATGLTLGDVGGRFASPSVTPMGPSAFESDSPPRRRAADLPDPVRLSLQLADGALERANRRPRLPRQRETFAFPVGPSGIPMESPIDEAASATGVSRHYLEALIGHESGGDPHAKASTSTATGSAQFIDSTWLRTMRAYGPRYGLGRNMLANLSDADILDLRRDATWSALMAAEYARENAAALRQALPHAPREGELYLAHFLGPGDAARLINAALADRRNVRGRPATQFVAAASVEANRSIFFTDGGRPRSASEVIELQTRSFRRAPFQPSERAALTD